ncbi:Dyp-type peroxidase [Saccharothrix sp. NRRL B-16314]|uniref:Dyp-type peroxidase n=1 Tax=Saccharothrix sp. NRRL B-16314 TaxID=1463825 RepID=UPI00052572E3|nr:Dyp-type peroxidase [Saccharothrix sp. NRRL B-16314]
MTDLLHLHAERRSARPLLRGSREIQGNVLAAFNKDHQRFRFVRFTDAKPARTWLAAMLGHVDVTADIEDFNEAFSLGRAVLGEDPAGLKATWTNVSLTPEGIVALSINPDATRQDLRDHFPRTAEQAADANGDTGDSAPAHWLFGRTDQHVHAVVTVASDAEDRLDSTTRILDLLDTLLGVTVVHEERAGTRRDQRGHEHFGYKDGISQPGVRYFHDEDPDQPGHRRGHPGQVLVNPGEFVFGYPTESARPSAAAWLTDGSIQVIRRLTQDVDGWNRAVEAHAERTGTTPVTMGARLIGRHKDGRPLAAAKHDNDFDYADDPDGDTTPCAAHIRKTNPRSFTYRTPRQHRILRRGTPFGQGENGEDTRDGERGLVFVAHCTSLEDQFEFVQRAWAGNPDFAAGGRGAPTGTDPVIGGHGGATVDGARLTFARFVRTTGALYALVPSVSTLRLLAAGRELPR